MTPTGGKRRKLRSLGLLLAGLAAGIAAFPSVAAETRPGASERDLVTVPPVPQNFKPGTTPWGDPDLRGTWPIDHLNFTPLQRTPEQGNRYFLTDEEYAARAKMLAERAKAYAEEDRTGKMGMGHWVEPGDANRRTSFLISPANGRLPELTAEGKRRAALRRSSYVPGQTYDWVSDFDIWDRCISRGLPASMFPFNYNNGIRIFQSPGLVAIQLEMIHEVRTIRLDDGARLPDAVDGWMGDSRGHWENGNTLVVETRNFTPQSSPVNVGTWGSPPRNDTPQSDQAKMVERFTVTGPDTIVYEVTYDDPVVYTAPWTARLDWKRDEKYQLFEYACHEGNVQIRGYINSSRAERAQAAAATNTNKN